MKAVFIVVALILMPAYALAAGPSFNCKKAKHPDEIAICGNVVLSENDMETTRLFQAMKVTNRKGAISIAKAFLKARRACGSNPQCIGIAQTAAIMTFHQNMRQSADTVPTVQRPVVIDTIPGQTRLPGEITSLGSR